jgi:aromatic ring-opening dioxygenase catalytic subunit (LigB family)
MPAVSLYSGEHIHDDKPPDHPDPSVRAATHGFHAPAPVDYPVASGLADHLIAALVQDGYDISRSSAQRPSVLLGHAFTFVQRRLMSDAARIPMVPVMINTYFAPNRPTAARCYGLGRAIARAVEGWPGDARIAVIGSGGLSHFVVLEEFDSKLLSALGRHDEQAIGAIPEVMFQTGTSETKSWIAAAGALHGLNMEVLDYVPCYRTLAGTGCAMGFAAWN